MEKKIIQILKDLTLWQKFFYVYAWFFGVFSEGFGFVYWIFVIFIILGAIHLIKDKNKKKFFGRDFHRRVWKFGRILCMYTIISNLLFLMLDKVI